VGVPPIRPGKKGGGDEKEDRFREKLRRLEHKKEQHKSDQSGRASRQIVGAEFAEEFFDRIEVHALRG
jgi:hypothetical protein